MLQLNINASKSYDVLIDSGLLEDCGNLIKNVTKAEKALLICGDTVDGLYADAVLQSLENAGFLASSFVYPHGEKSKTLDTFARIMKCLATLEFSKSDVIIALGGGVTGDLAGFAAASYMRGIDLVQIPTTLLAMVDSCVGGKCGVDMSQGKNMVGTVYQPKLVICDTDTLDTLPSETYAEGCAEIIKYAVLCKKELLTFARDDIAKTVFDCLSIKKTYVEGDELDGGMRRFLNLGHTVAHAIEEFSEYTVSHGKAVAMGLAVMTKHDTEVCAALEKYGLPTECLYPPSELCKLMLADKKRRGDRITLVVPVEIGKCRLAEIPVSELESFIFGDCHE